MKKLKLLIVAFCVTLSIPLAYFVLRTYRGLEQEEMATLNYFANTFFDEMEQTLGSMVQKEEGRAIDEYNFKMVPLDPTRKTIDGNRSPLSRLPVENFILGYFQNNPDGSFQTPLVDRDRSIPQDREILVAHLENANRIFNQKRVLETDRINIKEAGVLTESEPKQQTSLAEKFLDLSRSQKSRVYLGQKDKRLESITPGQALNIAKSGQPKKISDRLKSATLRDTKEYRRPEIKAESAPREKADEQKQSLKQDLTESEAFLKPEPVSDAPETNTFQVEVAPLQSVLIDTDQVFIFRRIMINQKIYRQGFILKIKTFLGQLVNNHFLLQPMAGFTHLRLSVMDRGKEISTVNAGVNAGEPDYQLNRIFPTPFAFLHATLTSTQIPRSGGRNTLNIMMIFLAAVFLIGLFAIYHSTRTIVDLSKRRSQFVSSVTHELKTPLTNIRMYIEMLSQGMARDQDREQAYFRIIDSEGARLTRLINNVLDLSKLEKKQRHIDLKPGTFEEVIREVEQVMQEKLKQDGFTLNVTPFKVNPFNYDREVMIQVLINLIENSMKFGKMSVKKEIVIRVLTDGDPVNILVSDFGPGIEPHALKKVFDEFYRVDNQLAKTTRGTGIGLALVRKFVNLMGGTVTAANNDGPGCTISISLPAAV